MVAQEGFGMLGETVSRWGDAASYSALETMGS